ncbi:MAG TPA: amidohydrolase family protein [Pyrinomonadaceae bacterium]|jgi:imidazolonepropionase-like amidohydrolase|nr:amidohydrolase family protein [Pyrinomonadaceae bacterium]
MRTRNSTSFAAVVCALAALLNFSAPPAVRAQDTDRPDPKMSGEPLGTYVIRNAHVVTVSGADIDNGTIVISNGRIASVGASAQVPAGAQEIDAAGLWVYPGMIDAATNMGLSEIAGGAPGTVDTQELGELNPNIAAWWGVNPHSSHINVTRVAGVTSVVTMPAGGIVSGQASVINLAGSSQREMTVVPAAALVIDFPRLGGSGNFANLLLQQQGITPEAVSARERRIDELRRILRDAEAYGRAQDAHARDPKNVPRPNTDLKLAALVPYVRGERPVLLRADRARDIRGALSFAQEMRLRPIILGGSDAGELAPLLKERNAAVILDSVLNLPLREDDPYDVLYATASRLQAAGVPFCISTGDSGAHVRDLPFQAGMAAAFGLPRAEALKSVTLYPAQIMGVADRMGSIEAGKIANLVVTDGDLLEARTNVRHLFIAGRQIPLVSRHTMLYEQFKDRK